MSAHSTRLGIEEVSEECEEDCQEEVGSERAKMSGDWEWGRTGGADFLYVDNGMYEESWLREKVGTVRLEWVDLYNGGRAHRVFIGEGVEAHVMHVFRNRSALERALRNTGWLLNDALESDDQRYARAEAERKKRAYIGWDSCEGVAMEMARSEMTRTMREREAYYRERGVDENMIAQLVMNVPREFFGVM
jgi:hypothetical protein